MDTVYPPEPFTLSAVDANALELLADQLVAETLRAHDEFLAQGRIVDLMRWKMVKEKNNMTAYRNRKRASSRFRRERVPRDETDVVMASPQLPSFYPAIDKKLQHALFETYPSLTFLEDDSEDELQDELGYVDVFEQNILEKARPERVPMVFCTGVTPGTVEDGALGFLADTEARSRTRNAGNRDVVVDDMRILVRIHGPSKDDPFRFLGVKWCCHSTPGAAGRFIKPRDYLVIESTGMALDSDGERFSYVLNHSIVLDEVPDYRNRLEHLQGSKSSFVDSRSKRCVRKELMEKRAATYPPMPLNVSAEDERSIKKIADRLVAETLRANEEFAAQGHVADPSCWKLIKEKNNIVAYLDIAKSRATSKRERFWSEDTVVVASSPQNPTLCTGDQDLQDLLHRGHLNTFDDSDSDDDKSLHHDEFTKFGAKGGSDTSVFEKFRPADVPVVFSSGVIPGTVEDMAFAFLADTDERSRTRFNTTKDSLVDDMRILAKIREPTKENPFQFLGIKWCSHTPGRAVSLVVKPRDYLIIESTGMAVDSNGERYSYLLNHSIEMDEVPTFREFGQVRTVFSTCHIIRPHKKKHSDGDFIEVFAKGFLILGGSFSMQYAATQLADGIVALPNTLEESYMKKLAWLVHDKLRWSSSSGSTSDTSTNSFTSCASSISAMEKAGTCSCCHAKLSSRLGGYLERASACSLCRQATCHKCTAKKALPVEGSRGRHMKKKEMEFCLTCYLRAKRLPAWNVAEPSYDTTTSNILLRFKVFALPIVGFAVQDVLNFVGFMDEANLKASATPIDQSVRAPSLTAPIRTTRLTKSMLRATRTRLVHSGVYLLCGELMTKEEY
ncbi:unnamed protein product [Phytophthora fragariaefolia]|uniref:Unnamed protein product n=1 Tax=Phytophthora fragariaefolia TaxID=1490495 RepID=A0A9W7CVU6_9STRA|nr:unnamed protein product [Phytophthora fragariaefolia]